MRISPTHNLVTAVVSPHNLFRLTLNFSSSAYFSEEKRRDFDLFAVNGKIDEGVFISTWRS
jgi:hypothetical protein